MNEIGELIKELAVNAVEAEKPLDCVIGSVLSINPLKIRIEQRLVIDERFIDVCKGAVFDENSQVLMLRLKGGKRYAVIDGIR